MILEIIGLIVVFIFTIWALFSSAIIVYWMTYGSGYDISGVTWSIVLLLVGLSTGYFGITNLPFDIIMRK